MNTPSPCQLRKTTALHLLLPSLVNSVPRKVLLTLAFNLAWWPLAVFQIQSISSCYCGMLVNFYQIFCLPSYWWHQWQAQIPQHVLWIYLHHVPLLRAIVANVLLLWDINIIEITRLSFQKYIGGYKSYFSQICRIMFPQSSQKRSTA